MLHCSPYARAVNNLGVVDQQGYPKGTEMTEGFVSVRTGS